MTSLGQLYRIVAAAEEFDCVEDLEHDREKDQRLRFERDQERSRVDTMKYFDVGEDDVESPESEQTDDDPALTESQVEGLLMHQLGATEIQPTDES